MISCNNTVPPASPVLSKDASPVLSKDASPRMVASVGKGLKSNAASASTACTASAAEQHHIWLVTGPAGCGKSTLAKFLAASFNLPFLEGDEFHPEANIEKMRNGTPLTDADRWDWLTVLRTESLRQISLGHRQVVLTCSALKRKYRDVIRVAPYFHTGVSLHFILLSAAPEVLLSRVASRAGHYMGANMVQSQLDILEMPEPDETDVMVVDVGRPLDAIRADIVERITAIVGAEKPEQFKELQKELQQNPDTNTATAVNND